MFESLDHLLGSPLPREAGLEEVVTARRAICVEADKLWDLRVRRALRDRRGNARNRRVFVRRMADRRDRGAIAAAHAGCADDARTVAEPALEIGEQPSRAGELAAEAVAHTDRDR